MHCYNCYFSLCYNFEKTFNFSLESISMKFEASIYDFFFIFHAKIHFLYKNQFIVTYVRCDHIIIHEVYFGLNIHDEKIMDDQDSLSSTFCAKILQTVSHSIVLLIDTSSLKKISQHTYMLTIFVRYISWDTFQESIVMSCIKKLIISSFFIVGK